MKKASTTPTKPAAPSALRRRLTNGLLVALAVAAALGIVVTLNYVVYWQYRGLSPDARGWVRYDLTSTRRYTLSPQSRTVLDKLETPHRLVTMLGQEDFTPDQAQRIRDLADEYARANQHITAEHIDLDTDADERAVLLSGLDAMFADDTASIRAAAADGLKKLETYRGIVGQLEQGLQKIIDDNVGLSPRDAQRLTDIHSQVLRLRADAEQIDKLRNEQLGGDWRARLENPGGAARSAGGEDLPDYTALMSAVQQYFVKLGTQTLPDIRQKADLIARGIRVSGADAPEIQEAALRAQNTLAAIVQQGPALEQQLARDINPLLTLTAPHRYDDARAVLADEPCVLILTDDEARVLPARLLFRGSGGETASDAADDYFVGEEQLTGAFISLALDPPPMVVFIRANTGQRALASAGANDQRIEGAYDQVANRLLAMDFDVVEWANPLSADPPTPKPGQKAVWITMPFAKPDPRFPQTLDTKLKEKVAAFVAERIAAGDGAVVMLGFNPEADPDLAVAGRSDPLIALLSGFGIDAQVYQNVFQLLVEDEDTGATNFTPSFLVSRWPAQSFLNKALTGIGTLFRQAHPLELSEADGVTHIPLVELNQPSMFVQKTPPAATGQRIEPVPGSERERVLIGAAAQRGDGRVVAIGDAWWAMDEVTTYAALPDGTAGANKADQPGARVVYPGNSDLFVSCVCWLAHQEDLIAASPRTQDIRRIDAVSPAGVKAVRVLLLGAMPGAVFCCGIGVWLTRRRG